MIKAVIIEDEPSSRELLTNLLNNFCENVDVLGEAHNVKSGIELITAQQPDLVFLDIEMPGGNGFDILNQIDDISFSVIFVTGYNKYALKAIKYSALDYLLKPIDLGELRMAIKKAEQHGALPSSKLRFLQKNYEEPDETIQQIILSEKNRHIVIDLNTICHLEAQGNYVLFHLDDKKTHLASYPLNYYEQLLPKQFFFRIHKSRIINLNKVDTFEKGRTGNVTLKDGTNLQVAARRKSAFVQMINKLR